MRQSWHHLLFLHWAVPVEELRPLIPPELTIDTFDGAAYVGLVPFTMTDVRPTWSPSVPGLSDFHEINVRTYVHYQGADPGVWFFSLDAANAIAVRLARATWSLPYHFARMALSVGSGGASDARHLGKLPAALETDIHYRTERLWPAPRPAACSVRYRPTGPVNPAAPGTLEHFLAERYLLYTARRRHLLRARIHHQPYPLQTAAAQDLDETMLAAAGIRSPGTTAIAHYARMVDVHIYGLHRVGAPIAWAGRA